VCWEVYFSIDATGEVDRRVYEPIDKFSVVVCQRMPLPHFSKEPVLVTAIVHNLRIFDFLERLQTFPPDAAFVVRPVGPERVFDTVACPFES
jgi:hypothetical protein